jgi:hypothetical protein
VILAHLPGNLEGVGGELLAPALLIRCAATAWTGHAAIRLDTGFRGHERIKSINVYYSFLFHTHDSYIQFGQAAACGDRAVSARLVTDQDRP